MSDVCGFRDTWSELHNRYVSKRFRRLCFMRSMYERHRERGLLKWTRDDTDGSVHSCRQALPGSGAMSESASGPVGSQRSHTRFRDATTAAPQTRVSLPIQPPELTLALFYCGAQLQIRSRNS